ncbi:MAG: protein kinase [Jatrophihabitans sp.]
MARTRRSKVSAGDFFAGFTDIAEIGIGSLATVFRAREPGTNRQVALKLLNVRDASPRAIESFERESIALGAVSSHPNIVTLYRSFRAADQRPVLVLELCSGSIADQLHNGQGLPVADVVALGIKVAGALETAHRAGILHRDVKPQNILITDFGEPALADFGVAMLQSSTQTTAGLFDFTTLHAAPELLEGGATSAATDVYELASTLYQLIAGRAAFRAYEGESPASVILRILRDPVQPLANARVPTRLSDLLIHAMSKDQANRPTSAADFAAELAAVEIDNDWPRTRFLVREQRAPGMSAGLPAPTGQPTSTPPHAVPEERSTPPLPTPDQTVRRSEPQPSVRAAMRIDEDSELDEPAVSRGSLDRFPVAPSPIDQQTTSRAALQREYAQQAPVEQPRAAPPHAGAEETVLRSSLRPPAGQQYPIPPAGLPKGPTSGAVPTWANRVPPQQQLDLRLDPNSLRRRMTIRTGVSALIIDEQQLVLRSWWRRRQIGWADVMGFEVRSDEPATMSADGRLVAITRNGRIDLPATRRASADLRYLHALLDAYRQRAQMVMRGASRPWGG